MPIGSLYQKYGVAAPKPGVAMVASQKATADSLKDALGGIENLLNQQEQKYREKNTLNMQEYLQDRLNKDGLSADPLDKVAIEQKFGSMIDMDKLDQTYKETQDKLENEAINSADQLGRKTFEETGDIAAAGEVFRKNLLNQKMDGVKANKISRNWRVENQFMDDDKKAADEALLGSLNSQMYNRLKSGEDVNTITESLFKENDVPTHLQGKAAMQLRKTASDISKMTPEQTNEFNDKHNYSQILMGSAIEAANEKVASAKASYDATTDYIPDSAHRAVEELNLRLGGANQAMGEDAGNGLVKGTIRFIADLFDKDALTGFAASNYIQKKIDSLVASGIDQKDAAAIAYQVYNDAKAASSTGVVGTKLDASQIDAKFETYKNAHVASQQALASYNKIKSAARKEIDEARLKANKTDSALREYFLKKNRTGKGGSTDTIVDSIWFKNKLNTKSNNSKINTTPKADKKDSNITANAISDRALKNTQANREGPEIDYDVAKFGANPNDSTPVLEDEAGRRIKIDKKGGISKYNPGDSDLPKWIDNIRRSASSAIDRRKQETQDNTVKFNTSRLIGKSKKEQKDYLKRLKRKGVPTTTIELIQQELDKAQNKGK